MRDVWRAGSTKHLVESLNWLFYTVFFGALPFWGVAIIYWLAQRTISIDQFVKNAEVIVYSAGLLSGSIPLMQKDVDDSPLRHPKWFLGVAVLTIAVAALIFGFVTGADAPMVSRTRMAIASVVMLAICLTLGFFTELISNIRLDPNIRAVKEGEVEDLASQVRRKLKGDTHG